MNTITGWSHDLGHVCPQPIPALATKEAPVARAAHRHSTGLCLIQNGIDMLGLDKCSTQALSLRIRVNLHNTRKLNRAAQAANTQFFAWRQATNRPREHTIDTGTAQRDRDITLKFEEFL